MDTAMRDLILIVAGLAVPGIILAIREYFGVWASRSGRLHSLLQRIPPDVEK